MAVCGRCLICGHKFDGDTTPDVGVMWDCKCTNEACKKSRKHMAKSWNEIKTHKICTSCIEKLADGSTLPTAVADLLALLARRGPDY